jgi:hypothetical protein
MLEKIRVGRSAKFFFFFDCHNLEKVMFLTVSGSVLTHTMFSGAVIFSPKKSRN